MKNILFLDIETVPCVESHDKLDERMQHLWPNKAYKFKQYGDGADKTDEELFNEKAGILAEFGKIVCISVGCFRFVNDPDTDRIRPILRVSSFASDNESELLQNFADMLNKSFNNRNKYFFAAHNGIEFDYPYICRRMLINRITLPEMLCVSGTKSWNNKHLLDTMDMWKFGDYKGSVSLDLLAACLGIDTSKNDISGADVARVYYKDKDLARIVHYCEKDVKVLAEVFCGLNGYQLPQDIEISRAADEVEA